VALFRKPADDASEVTRLAQDFLGRRGLLTTLEDTGDLNNPGLRTTSGEIYFLGNVVAKCSSEPRRVWKQIIGEHFDSLLNSRDVIEPEDLDPASLRRQIRTRLLMDMGEADRETYGYARAFAPGVIMVLCVDYPQTVRTLNSSTVGKLPIMVDELFIVGQANVDAEPVDEHEELSSGSGVIALSGGSLFIATKVANMPKVIDEYLPPAPHGVVFAIPHRGLVLCAVPTSVESVQSVQNLILFSNGFAEGRYGPLPGGPVSSGVFYWSADGVEQIAGKAGMKPLDVDATGRFGDMLNELPNA
jgi:hypothetical protein